MEMTPAGRMGLMHPSLIIIGVVWMCIPAALSQTHADETALRANLSSGYNRFVRPNSPTNVTLYYSVRALQVLDITEQRMTLTGWMSANWVDDRLVWDNSTNQITQIEIDWGWRPEFVISNSADGFAMLGFTNDLTRLSVYSDGLMKWNQLLHSTTSCAMDITNFPFDSQSCEVEIKFWGYSVEQVMIYTKYTTVQTDIYIANAEWELEGTTAMCGMVTLCCPESDHTVLKLTLNFTRRRPFYVMNLIFPTILLSICLVWVFLLPTESGERIGFTLTILLAYVVQLSIIAELMPTTSRQIPHIARYLLIVLVLCFVVTCNIVLHVKLYFLEGPVYKWVKTVYKKAYPIVYLECSVKKRSKPSKTTKVIDISTEKENFHKRDLSAEGVTSQEKEAKEEEQEEITWVKVAAGMDRICFCIYVLAITIVNAWFLGSIS